MNFRKIAAAVAAAAVISLPVAANASTVRLGGPVEASQFTAFAESRTVLVTPARLVPGEVIRLGLDGQPFTVITESFNGGGTVFTVSPVLPDADRTLLFTF